MKRTKEGASYIQVRRINRQWCVVSYFNVNWYRPKCTGCVACDGSIPALKGWKHSPDYNRRIVQKYVDILKICNTRSEANREADIEGIWEEQNAEAWSDVWNEEF